MTDNKWKVFEFDEIFIEKIDIKDFLTIRLIGEINDENYFFEIIFHNFVSFNLTDESYRISYFDEMDPGLVSLKPFLKFKDSDLIKKFQQENLGIYKSLEITHYAIYTKNDCMDILSRSEPIIRMCSNEGHN